MYSFLNKAQGCRLHQCMLVGDKQECVCVRVHACIPTPVITQLSDLYRINYGGAEVWCGWSVSECACVSKRDLLSSAGKTVYTKWMEHIKQWRHQDMSSLYTSLSRSTPLSPITTRLSLIKINHISLLVLLWMDYRRKMCRKHCRFVMYSGAKKS